MREIKFRGFNRKNEKWLYGYYFMNRGKHFIVTDGTADPFSTHEDYIIDPDTVGQYTGLTDSDGTEIYEGDIFQVKAYEPRFEVYFKNGVFEYRQIGSSNRPFPLRRIYFDSFILGNIHDNPELLEGK